MTSPTIDYPDEQLLVAQLREGSARAFETLVRQHGGRMLAVAGRFLKCEQDRDDAVQEAFISAFRAIGTFDGDARLSTWLHRVTVNCCLMKLRSRSRRPEAPIDDLLPSFDDTGHRANVGPAWDHDAIDDLTRSELRGRVRQCIDELPESYRTVLLLRDIEGLDTEETARQLNCSLANVKTRLHRARQALRTLLEPHVKSL